LNNHKLFKTKQVALILLFVLCICAVLSVENQIVKAQDDSYLVILSPVENTTCLAGAPLNLSISGQWFSGCDTSISVSYSIDGQDTIQIPAELTTVPYMVNITYANGITTVGPSSFFIYYVLNNTIPLPAMQAGLHSLTVYAIITFSGTSTHTNNYQATVSFTVNDPTLTISPDNNKQQPVPFTALIAGIAVAAVAITASGILVYHFKTKSNMGKFNRT
jgi:hypothetical protein